MKAKMLQPICGVRREGVTVAADRLQDSGALSYVRGYIKILERQKLEETDCECYRVVKDEFDRLLISLSSDMCVSALTITASGGIPGLVVS